MTIDDVIGTDCTGCFACQSVCPASAITVSQDDKGFYVPAIDKILCHGCGMCIRYCPQIHDVDLHKAHMVYAVSAKNTEVVRACSSGGAFAVFANHVIRMDGFVGGCFMDRDLIARECVVNNEKQLGSLYGSKYVQSCSDGFITEIRKINTKRAPMVICGTPCQIAGVVKAVKLNETTITIDVICHGVTSPALFLNHIKNYQTIHNCVLLDVQFRSKDQTPWGVFCVKYSTSSCTSYIRANSDPYYATYLSGIAYASACYRCKYSRMDRVSDITIGDCWGSERLCSKKILKKSSDGISVVVINTEKGRNLFDQVKNQFEFEAISYDAVSEHNHNLKMPTTKPRMEFYDKPIDDGAYIRKMSRCRSTQGRLLSIVSPRVIEIIKKLVRKVRNYE